MYLICLLLVFAFEIVFVFVFALYLQVSWHWLAFLQSWVWCNWLRWVTSRCYRAPPSDTSKGQKIKTTQEKTWVWVHDILEFLSDFITVARLRTTFITRVQNCSNHIWGVFTGDWEVFMETLGLICCIQPSSFHIPHHKTRPRQVRVSNLATIGFISWFLH